MDALLGRSEARPGENMIFVFLAFIWTNWIKYFIEEKKGDVRYSIQFMFQTSGRIYSQRERKDKQTREIK